VAPSPSSTTEGGDARDILATLSLAQKVALLAGVDTWHTASFDDPPVPAIRMSDGPAGVRGTSWSGPPSASFPCGTALGATWDPDLVAEVGQAIGREAHAKSAHVVLAPTVNLQRTPIGGRNFECYSEDPVLTARLSSAYIRGLQRERVAACVKHFVGNDTELERMTISSEVDERTLRELYLVPFEAAVTEAGTRSIMTAYNRLNGTFCSEHRWLIDDVLRGEWGFDGVVVSDWFGTHSAVESVRVGLDLEMPGPPRERGGALLAAVERGELDERDLDPLVTRILELGAWVGAGSTGTQETTADDPATHEVIRRAAARGTVLLKNEQATLPLAPSTRRIALIGPYARFGRPQGGGSARVRAEHGAGPFEALQARGFDVELEPGGSIARYLPVVRGDFAATYTDHRGSSVETTAERLTWYWDGEPAAGIDATRFSLQLRGAFVPDVSGEWEFGTRAVGPVTVRLDGEPVVTIDEPTRGGAFFGMGSPEVRGTATLDAGRRYELTVDYPLSPDDERVRGLAVGARPVPPGDHIERAAALAATCDVAVVVVGTDDDWETEGEDRTGLALPLDQDDLVAAVAAANPTTIVVVNTGSPVTMPWLDAVPAVLQLWFPGQELGDALVDVLTGAVEPGGRLPTTFPRRLEDTPAYRHYPGEGDGRAVYGEGLFIGHRWYDRERIEPLFPFGFGLGYTTFELGMAVVAGSVDDGVTVEISVRNTGSRAGSDVVQVYVEPPAGDGARPLRTLAGFARIDLEPGEQGTVFMTLGHRAFASWLDGAWTVRPGDYVVHAGHSSRDLAPAGTVTVS
jgi:beta-glucosidase